MINIYMTYKTTIIIVIMYLAILIMLCVRTAELSSLVTLSIVTDDLVPNLLALLALLVLIVPQSVLRFDIALLTMLLNALFVLVLVGCNEGNDAVEV